VRDTGEDKEIVQGKQRKGDQGNLSCKIIASLVRFREIRGRTNMLADSGRNEAVAPWRVSGSLDWRESR
jgi:hypothetical protein